MEKIAQKIAKHSKSILMFALILLIPSIFGYIKTDINYDILSYLPNNISTTQAEKILKDDFGCGTLAMLIVENMDDKDVAKIKDKVAKVDGVEEVLWVDDFMDLSVPKEILPKDMTDFLYNGDKSTMMIVKMEKATGDIKTQNAVSSIRNIAGKQSFLSGMCGILKDTKDLADKEVPLYILAASILILIILGLTLESSVIPIIFLTSIGMAVIYNFGSNIIFGEISYITKALAAVLQLGVTMDYSIFLLHRYEEEKYKYPDDKKTAMAKAITNTVTSVFGSSITTIAGFLALCVMELGFGKDIGLVMAKGVLIGVISTVTILPSFILVFDKQIEKYKHKTILPKFNKVSKGVVKHYKKLSILFVIIFIPAYFGYKNADVYYNLDESLPDDFPSIIATNKMKVDYDMESTNFILVKDSVAPNDISEMIKEIENIDGITSVIGLEKYIGPRINQDFLPQDILSEIKSNGYEEILVNSKYKAATDECNDQIEKLNKIVHKYDKDGLVGGEAPLTLDLIKIANTDFTKVNAVSIAAIFIIIAVLFKSLSLPVILVLAIECAIFVNLGIPYYTGTVEPFIASIVLGTIQLGATVDYAILLTSRFKEERNNGYGKFEAMERSISGCAPSILTSALTFFGATVGVGLLSKLEMISSLCSLMSRGAIVSMFMIIFILPAILLLFESLIIKTSKNFIDKNDLAKETN
ncbi:efflux RND transporter permease subunit [Terrisporobacter sp.]|uniref:efflux RND transporter permease subunit n=1 Tax=Terrisporobacter sp. TaxID=1965305 RepID=UPI00260FA80E|nr:MMPL family transporter [Terrisporobacter sp.]